MKTIKQALFSNWHFMRWLRLIFGVFFMVQALQMHDWLVGTIAGFFLITAIANVGCCGAGNCAVRIDEHITNDKNSSTKSEPQEIIYEEIES